MKRFLVLCATFAAAAGIAGMALAGKPVPGTGQGWTGITNPQDLIIAVDFVSEKGDGTTFKLPNAETISVVLLAIPHLFPPTTNVYDPGVKQPETLALPGIWKDFTTFYTLASATSDAAETLSHATGADAISTGAFNLRESCDACHDLFVLPYTPPVATGEERNFDFDSVFPKN